MCLHRHRSGWNSGGRMASAEGGSVPSGVGYGERCPLSSRLGSPGERCELLQRGPWQSLGRNWFRRILKATERSFLYLYNKIWGGQFALASPSPNSGRSCPPLPRDLRPCVPSIWLVRTVELPWRHRRCGVPHGRWHQLLAAAGEQLGAPSNRDVTPVTYSPCSVAGLSISMTCSQFASTKYKSGLQSLCDVKDNASYCLHETLTVQHQRSEIKLL